MRKASVAILASGEGTTAEYLAEYFIKTQSHAQVSCVISNNKAAGVFRRMQRLNDVYGASINCLHIGKDNFPATEHETILAGHQTQAEISALETVLEEGAYDLILLLGYMKLVDAALVRRFGWHDEYTSPYQASMLNTHPGLLPATKGLFGIHVQEYVLSEGLAEAGQTLHVVAEKYDEGPTIAENRIPVEANDTPEKLFERVKEAEKRCLPGGVLKFISTRQELLEGVAGKL